MTAASVAAPGTHVVQFYEGDRFLRRAVLSFVSQAAEHGDPVVMISRQTIFETVSAQLVAAGSAPDAIHFVDVNEALESLMDGAMPDRSRAERSFVSLIGSVGMSGNGHTIWIYGEMVDVLCRAGNHAAAVGLEELWNRYYSGPRFSVMCGYGIQNFDEDLHANHFRAVCRQHSHVIPAEGYLDAPDDRSRLEQVAFLQQRARALAGALAQPASSTEPAAALPSTIYIIDDDESVRRSMGRLLTSMSLSVHTFASAEAFLAEVDRTAAGCLIVDIQLVGMSGSELQERMTRMQWTMSVIAMSGAHTTQIESEAMRLGATAFLRKPFTTRALISALERSLGRSI
jgi:CheY-like chemotaxis protein